MVHLLCNGKLSSETRLVVAGFSVRSDYFQNLLDEHTYITVAGRLHTMERSVVAPTRKDSDLLQLVSELTLVALNRRDVRFDDVSIFLSGMIV